MLLKQAKHFCLLTNLVASKCITSSGKKYATATCDLLRKLYHKLPPLRFSAVVGVKHRNHHDSA